MGASGSGTDHRFGLLPFASSNLSAVDTSSALRSSVAWLTSASLTRDFLRPLPRGRQRARSRAHEYMARMPYLHAKELFPRLKHLWLDAGYRGEEKGRGWVEKVLGWTVELVERPRNPAPERVLKLWAAEWAKEGEKVDWQKLMPPRGFQVLPRRWVVERTFSWIDHNRRMSKDYERLPESSEAFIYVAMSRLMARRLAR